MRRPFGFISEEEEDKMKKSLRKRNADLRAGPIRVPLLYDVSIIALID